MAGWLDSISSHCRVLLTSIPLRCRARISSCGESGFSAGDSSSTPQLAVSASSLAGRWPGGGRAQDSRPGSAHAGPPATEHRRAAFRRRSWHRRIRRRAAVAAARGRLCWPAAGLSSARAACWAAYSARSSAGVAGAPRGRGPRTVRPGPPAGAGGCRARGGCCVIVLGRFSGVLRVCGVGGELRVRQDRAAQAQVVAALQLHAGGQQCGIPVLGAVPDPARPPLFEAADDARAARRR